MSECCPDGLHVTTCWRRGRSAHARADGLYVTMRLPRSERMRACCPRRAPCDDVSAPRSERTRACRPPRALCDSAATTVGGHVHHSVACARAAANGLHVTARRCHIRRGSCHIPCHTQLALAAWVFVFSSDISCGAPAHGGAAWVATVSWCGVDPSFPSACFVGWGAEEVCASSMVPVPVSYTHLTLPTKA